MCTKNGPKATRMLMKLSQSGTTGATAKPLLPCAYDITMAIFSSLKQFALYNPSLNRKLIILNAPKVKIRIYLEKVSVI